MLAGSPLCRCICGGSRKDDPFDVQKVFGEQKDSRALDYEEPSQQDRPEVVGVLSYYARPSQPLRGTPIREGQLWLLSGEDEVSLITVCLHVNGFSFKHSGQENSFAFTPFALVRNCKFQAVTNSGIDLAQLKCFKVSLFTQGACFFFGIYVNGHNSEEAYSEMPADKAEDERSRWVLDFSRAIRLVTQSLFPTFQISCDPLLNVLQTRSRIMAGYLAHHDDPETVSVVYCELHPQSDGKGRFIIYENESCKVSLRELCITDRFSCTEKVGISCSCFTIDEHLFSTRTVLERKLWLRAISNVKVKVANKAPNPEDEEIKEYRSAIREFIQSSKELLGSQGGMDALLRRFDPMPAFPAAPLGYENGHCNNFGFPQPPPSKTSPFETKQSGLGLPATANADPSAISNISPRS
jgi:hypothetical protein